MLWLLSLNGVKVEEKVEPAGRGDLEWRDRLTHGGMFGACVQVAGAILTHAETVAN